MLFVEQKLICGWMLLSGFNIYDSGSSVLKAMFLVYCALEKEPVPMSLPPALVPPSKRKTGRDERKEG